MLLCDENDCTGCMACVNICPKNSIQIIENEEGFKEPKIDEEKCIKCKRCTKTCPILNMPHKEKASDKVYAIWSKDKKIRFSSTSGGFFTELSKYILKHKGIIYGAVFDEKFRVIHKGIEHEEELKLMRGSKYVQSDISKCFKEVKEKLEEDRLVLFTGTACQIAALNSFIGQEKENLITVDLLCHGVPSPKIFEEYKKYIEKKYNSKIEDIKFRYKKPGWEVFSMKVDFESGKTYIESTEKDPYIRGFLRKLYLRPACSKCHFTNLNRQGDFTCADFWGYQSSTIEDANDDKGISMVMVNSFKAENIFRDIKENLNCYVRDIQDAINGNRCLSESYPASEQRDEFWKDYNKERI